MRCQDCKYWKNEIPQRHTSVCEITITQRVIDVTTGKFIFADKVDKMLVSRYSNICHRFEKKKFRRRWYSNTDPNYHKVRRIKFD